MTFLPESVFVFCVQDYKTLWTGDQMDQHG